MANSEDVLTIYDEMAQGIRDNHKSDWEDLAEALAAEVRELRRDRARLDWLERTSGRGFAAPVEDPIDESWWVYGTDDGEWTGSTIREVIDAAMGGGEEKVDGG